MNRKIPAILSPLILAAIVSCAHSGKAVPAAGPGIPAARDPADRDIPAAMVPAERTPEERTQAEETRETASRRTAPERAVPPEDPSLPPPQRTIPEYILGQGWTDAETLARFLEQSNDEADRNFVM